MAKFKRYEQYEGPITNPTIKKAEENIAYHKLLMDAEQAVIDKIRAECEHSYYFYCRGMYVDHYICIKCGDEEEH